MFPGMPRRPAARHRAPPEPPLPPGWSHVTSEAPPASWSGLPRPESHAQPRTPLPRYDRLPRFPGEMPPPVPAAPEQRGTARLQISRNAKAIVAAIGGALTVLAMVDGLGIIPPDAREIFAVLAAAATPIVIYFIPDWKPPTEGKQ